MFLTGVQRHLFHLISSKASHHVNCVGDLIFDVNRILETLILDVCSAKFCPTLHGGQPRCIWPLWSVLTTYLDPISSYSQGLFQGFEWCHLSETPMSRSGGLISNDFLITLGASHWNIMNYIKKDCDWQPFRGKDSSCQIENSNQRDFWMLKTPQDSVVSSNGTVWNQPIAAAHLFCLTAFPNKNSLRYNALW